MLSKSQSYTHTHTHTHTQTFHNFVHLKITLHIRCCFSNVPKRKMVSAAVSPWDSLDFIFIPITKKQGMSLRAKSFNCKSTNHPHFFRSTPKNPSLTYFLFFTFLSLCPSLMPAMEILKHIYLNMWLSLWLLEQNWLVWILFPLFTSFAKLLTDSLLFPHV